MGEYRPKGKRNDYVIGDTYSQLIITDQNGNIKKIVLIDTEDVEKLKKFSFRVHNNNYIETCVNGKSKYLHQIVMGEVDKGYEIDHINRNKLDNRKNNLRVCKHIDNTHNRVKSNTFLQQGITKLSRLKTKPYQVRIANKHIGYYSTLEEAIRVRQQKEKELYKEFSPI